MSDRRCPHDGGAGSPHAHRRLTAVPQHTPGPRARPTRSPSPYRPAW
ncbi:hypothetical protein GZL_08237 [Streptomyces sp. 769]|nr:hypothetical protein GZL_08237 [Streptomyces sp. 769]